VDPFEPFIAYFIARGEWLAAIGLALVVLAILLVTYLLNRRSGVRPARISVDSHGDGNQTTIVSDVSAKGDVTVAPRQRNG
jgi:hypothetical protein